MKFPRLVPLREHAIWLALIALQLALAVAGASRLEPPAPAPPPGVVRIYYDDPSQLDELAAYDLLEYNNLDQQYVLAVVSEPEYIRLQASGWRIAPDELRRQAVQAPGRFYDGYLTVDELYASMRALHEAHPALSDLVAYGDSYCRLNTGCLTVGGEFTPGRELLAVRVTNKAIPGSSTIDGRTVTRGRKPVFFLLANLHARELTTPEIALRWLELALEQYGQDPAVTWLVDWHELWIVPTANPDGHWVVELGTLPPYNGAPLLHRKNLDQDADADGRLDCPVWPSNPQIHAGVDLNRNHSFAWQNPDQAVSPCAQTYPGPAPASEPEVVALQSLLQALFADRRGPGLQDTAPQDTSGLLISLHNFSELVLYPWGHTTAPAPNRDGLQAVAQALAALNGYRACQPAECLYLAHGTTDDWAYGELGLPAFTFEIGTSYQGFAPPYSVIENEQWPENRRAFLLAAALSRAPYQLVEGPEVEQVRLASEGGGVSLTAVIDDRRRGAQTIAAAEYALDTPFWESAAAVRPMAALDGHFDSPQESVGAKLALDGLPNGRHTLFVRGIDGAGNAGVPTAVFLDIPYLHTAYLPFALGVPALPVP